MNLTLYRNSAVSAAFTIGTQTAIKRRLMVENTLSISVSVPKNTPLDVRVGDYTDIEGERYVVMDLPKYALRNGVYGYDILLRGNLHRLEVYTMPDEGRDEWWYYGGPIQQIDKVVAVLNTKEPGWSAVYPDLGDLADTTPKNLNYANMSILSALHAIASTENGWALEFDITGKVIRFARQIKTPTALRFEYGRGKGLYELSRGELSNEKLATRVVAYGASTNMPNGMRLSMAPVNGGLDYVDCRTESFGVRETRINYDHIYPRRNASITADAVQVEAGKANWTVADTTLDFDLNAQAAEGAVILFATGDCVGVEFEIVHYDPATQTITFKEYVDQSAAEPYILPNASRWPKAGDAYILVNILMPDSYVTAAQRELKAAAVADAQRLSQPQYSYSVECDPRFVRALAHRPVPGDACRIVDAPHGVDYTTRIVGLEYPLVDPTRVKLTLAEKVAIPSAVVLAKSVKEVKTKLGLLDRGQLTEAQLRKIFHPLGGSPVLDFAAQDLTARNATVAENAKAANVYASQKVISPFVSSPEFLAAMLGYGFGMYVDKNGESHVMADHLHGRVSFETLEMRYRKLLVSGEDLLVSSGGQVEKVLPYGQTLFSTPDGRLIITQDRRKIIVPSNGRVVFKLKGEPGIDLQQFVVDDILRYTWRDTQTGNSGASGWLRVKKCFDTFWYEAEQVSGSPEWLQQGMTVGQMGNYTQTDRQGFINISGRDKQIAIWDEVDSHLLKPSMLKVYLGDLRYVTDPDFPMMQGFGLYAQSVFLKGVFVLKNGKRVDEEFERVETEFLILDGKITSKVSQTTYAADQQAVQQQMTSMSEQTAEGFRQTVQKGSIISSINQTAEQVKIKAAKIALEGTVTANNNVRILPNGSIEAKNANISGKIQATSGTFNEVLVNGTFTTPFQNGYYELSNDGSVVVSTLGVHNHNNVVIPGTSAGWLTAFMMPFSTNSNGFRVTLLNEQFGGQTPVGAISASASGGMSFYENGAAYSSLVVAPYEGVELIGLGEGEAFKGWIVLNRFPTRNVPRGGGLIMGGAVGGQYGTKRGDWGRSFDVSRLSQGVYEITHTLNHTDYFITVTPVNSNQWNNGRAVVRSKGLNSFVVAIYDINSADGNVDCDFDFMVCGRN